MGMQNLFTNTQSSPGDIAERQQKYNINNIKLGQAQLMNQSNPYGSQNYVQTGTYFDPTTHQTLPTYSLQQTLSPENQGLLSLMQGNQAIGDIAGGGIGAGLAGLYSGGPLDLNALASGPTSEMMQRQLAYRTPLLNQQTNNLDTQLRNQGLFPGNPSYDNAMRTLRDTQTREQGDFINSAQNQMFNQANMQFYSSPLDAFTRLMYGPINPTFGQTPTTQTAPTNAADATKQALAAQQQSWNVLGSMMPSAQMGSGMSGLMGGGGAGAGAGGAAAGGAEGASSGMASLGEGLAMMFA